MKKWLFWGKNDRFWYKKGANFTIFRFCVPLKKKSAEAPLKLY
jgi:hypothetical protein